MVEEVFGADVAVAALGSGFDGLSVSSDDVTLILLAATTMPARQRFTLAHELGHLLAGETRERLRRGLPDAGRAMADGGGRAPGPFEVRPHGG